MKKFGNLSRLLDPEKIFNDATYTRRISKHLEINSKNTPMRN